MNKKIVTWAVAALFAVPAIPLFAKTHHTAKVSYPTKIHAKTMISSKKHRTTHHHKKHHKAATTVKKGHTALASRAHSSKKLSHTSSTSMHSAKAASSIHPTVLMNNQPTIDAMHT
jgi:hypothetical protein